MKCIVCFSEAEVIFEGSTLCIKHFDMNWRYRTEGENVGTLVNMKKEIDRLIQEEIKKKTLKK